MIEDSLDNAIQGVESLESWVKAKVDEWRDHYRNNYQEEDERYQRIFRGVFNEKDRERKSEKSKLISPATLQAVESAAAEIEEAVFGRGKFFDMEDNPEDPDKKDIPLVRKLLHKEFKQRGFKSKIREVILTSAIFGNGMAEIITEEIEERRPAQRPAMGGELRAVGVEKHVRVVCDLIPLQPRNFLIDPAATSIDNALGVAVDRQVSPHQIEIMQEKGVYLDTQEPLKDIQGTESDADADPDLPAKPKEETRLVKYFGLVPRALLDDADQTKDQKADEDAGLIEPEKDDSYYVEAIVVMTHDGTLLKASKNPHMMQDRDVVNFTWDTLPGMFRGRGIAEKGGSIQKALDAELRGRVDALAYTIHPMLAMDATRMPRGVRPEVRPGKVLPVHGDPRTAILPFNWGTVSDVTFPQQQALEGMHQRATGAVDLIPGNVNGDTAAAAMSMQAGAVVKRYKRTQENFEDGFLIPMVKKVAWRKMQYDADNFPVGDYDFCVRGGLGMIAREYEVSQLSMILQVIKPDSPLFLPVLQAIVEHLNVSNREQFQETLEEAAKPDPEAQKRAQEAHEAQMKFQTAQTSAFEGTAAEANARAEKYHTESSVIPQETQIKMIDTVLRHQDELEPGFKQQLEIFKSALEERRQNTAEFEASTRRMDARSRNNGQTPTE